MIFSQPIICVPQATKCNRDTIRIVELLVDCEARLCVLLRVLQHIAVERLDAAIAVGLMSGFGNDWLRVGAVKMFLDGALGSRTAWMREPYENSR